MTLGGAESCIVKGHFFFCAFLISNFAYRRFSNFDLSGSLKKFVCMKCGASGTSPPIKYHVFVPVVSTEGGARAAGATLIVAVYYLNIRVRADIDVISSP